MVGLFYNTVIVSETLNRMRHKHHDRDSTSEDLDLLGLAGGRARDVSSHRFTVCGCSFKHFKGAWRRLKKRMNRVRFLTRVRRFTRSNLLIVTVLLQLLNFVILYICDTQLFKKDSPATLSAYLSFAFQVLQCIVVILVTFKFVSQTEMVTAGFLVQSFLSWCCGFAGEKREGGSGEERGESVVLSCRSSLSTLLLVAMRHALGRRRESAVLSCLCLHCLRPHASV